MHELAITKQLVADILAQLPSSSQKIVRTVSVEVGELTSYKSAPIKYYFDLLKREHDALKEAQLYVCMVAGENIILKALEVE